ncbi:MAG: hypothetical protein OXJ53_03240 [Gammaproteobacteria bacterium]|nr:hypothetical protein [Gammaproteobacteria bacterium]MDD9962857.1 hypothetical protein [Gammaproteobacteria bacterium]MDE0271428.1 hypothetical protein [Gammaproteobacteria bacterium]
MKRTLLLIGTISMMLVLPVPSSADSAQACRNAWKNSPAWENGCTSASWDVMGSATYWNEETNQCDVHVICQTDGGYPRELTNNFSGTPSEVQSLDNCNGELKVGSCD